MKFHHEHASKICFLISNKNAILEEVDNQSEVLLSTSMKRIRRFFISFPSPLPLIFIVVGTILVILYGRGYRPNLSRTALTQPTITPTGLLSATSDPIGSQVYIDNELKTATNNTINLEPNFYTVTIAKEGYIPWQKKLRVQGEVVTRTDPFLFPSNPSLSPLTTVGILKPTLSPNGNKIAYIIPTPAGQNGLLPARAGIWVYELTERNLGFSRDQRQIASIEDGFDYPESTLTWSPDSSELLVQVNDVARLYQAGQLNKFTIVSGAVKSILADWEVQQNSLNLQKLTAFKQPFIDVATSSAKIISFSPDETKLLYEATAAATIPQMIEPPLIGTNPTQEARTIEANKIYVYDSKEDKNYFIFDKSELPQNTLLPSPTTSTALKKKTLPAPSASPTLATSESPNLHWFPTSRHLVVTVPGKIDIMEYDRTNWVTVYSGPFLTNFIAPWSNGSRIIILTNLNPGVSTLPNLYTVNLR